MFFFPIAINPPLVWVLVRADYTKTKGVKVKKTGEVIDKTALIKAVAEGKLPDVIFDINQGHINRLINMGIVFPADAVKVIEEAKYGGRG